MSIAHLDQSKWVIDKRFRQIYIVNLFVLSAQDLVFGACNKKHCKQHLQHKQ